MALRKARRLPQLALEPEFFTNGSTAPAPVTKLLECGCWPVAKLPPTIRCDVHRDLLLQVIDRWQQGTGWERKELWQEADGLGRRGYVPEGGRYDINALSLSSAAAIERMFKILLGFGPLDDGHAPDPLFTDTGDLS